MRTIFLLSLFVLLAMFYGPPMPFIHPMAGFLLAFGALLGLPYSLGAMILRNA